VRLAKQVMPSKGVPFPIDEWPSVVIRGLEVLNKTQLVPRDHVDHRQPGETDDDVKSNAGLDLRGRARGLFAFLSSRSSRRSTTREWRKRGESTKRLRSPRCNGS
jgi:hypothetical protein